jgi:predicted nucleotidyltransferase component of viral defense system
MDEKYLKQVKLVVDVLQVIATETCFALKGGTAINLFYNNLPRLSIDIDLTYLGFETRNIACQNINAALNRITENLKNKGYIAKIQGNNIEKKIICANSETAIKIEPNYIIRGYVEKPKILAVCDKVEDEFGYAEIQVISKKELYGGKICAALDRQHPRDLFDIKELINKSEIDEELIKGFIVMLLSHDKPLHETLNPNIKDQNEIFEKQFIGMTNKNFSYEQHIETLTCLIHLIKNAISPYKQLLLDFVSLKSNLRNFGIENLEKLPAIKWKLKNLEKLQENNPIKFKEQYEKLIAYFEE